MTQDNKADRSVNIDGDVEGGVIVTGNKNVLTIIQNFVQGIDRKTLILIICIVLIATVGLTMFIIRTFNPTYDTSYMSGQLNIAVEPFLEEKNGRLGKSEQGLILSQYFFSRLQSEVQSGAFEQETGIRMEIRGPQDVPPLRNISWTSPDLSAQEVATRINAHIVIYGIVTYDELDRPYVSIRFYISPDQFGDAQEILGENELGMPFLLTGNPKSGVDLEGENQELRNRIQVVSLLMKAIGAYVGEDFPLSLAYLESALSDDLWKQASGKEVVYLLAGNVLSRQALPILLTEGETSGLDTIKQAEYYYEQAIQSASQKGEYARAYIGLAGVENFYAAYEARLTGNLSDVNLDALDREEEYLDNALAANYKPNTADIDEKVAFNKAQVALLRYQYSGQEQHLFDAEANYKFVVDSYNAGNSRVRELAAHSHSGLAIISRFRDDSTTALAEYEKALKITRTPSLQAMYLYHTGNVYYETKDFEKALNYYNKALEMREDLIKRVPDGQIKIVEQRILEIEAELQGIDL